MQPKGPLVVLSMILMLAAGAGVILALEGFKRGDAEVHAEEFQKLVGGLGMGPALDLSRCPNSFDPRLCGHCPEDVGPIPGGGYFCPHHACSIFYYPALKRLP